MVEKYINIMQNNNLLEHKNVIFLCSGGKDATFGLELFLQYMNLENIDINLSVILIEYPKHVYYDKNGCKRIDYIKYIEKYRKQGIDIVAYATTERDINNCINEGCNICKQSRKKIVDEEIKKIMQINGNVTIITGYTLYDAMAYIEELMICTNYTLDFSKINNIEKVNRIQNCIHKMQLKENLPNGNTIIRPLLYFDEKSILRYMYDNDLIYISTPCLYSEKKHKRRYFATLDLLEEENNVTYEGIMALLKKCNVSYKHNFDDIKSKQYFIDC